jgi:hypothetical protein
MAADGLTTRWFVAIERNRVLSSEAADEVS